MRNSCSLAIAFSLFTRVTPASRAHRLAFSFSLCIPEQAFPSISTGVYGYPIKSATETALSAVGEFLSTSDGSNVSSLAPALFPFSRPLRYDFVYLLVFGFDLGKQNERVVFVVFGDKDRGVYEETLPRFFPPEAGSENL